MYSLTFSYDPFSPTFAATKSLSMPLTRTVIVVVLGMAHSYVRI
jgi:hypothetical protein